MKVQSRTGRDWLCDTGVVTATRLRGPRPGGPFAPTAAETAVVTGWRHVRRAGGSIAGIAVETRDVGFGGWTARAGAWGGSLRLGEEVR